MNSSMFRKPWRVKLAAAFAKIAWWMARPTIAGVPVFKHYDIVASVKGPAIGNGKAMRVDEGGIMLDHFEAIDVKQDENQKLADAIDELTKETT